MKNKLCVSEKRQLIVLLGEKRLKKTKKGRILSEVFGGGGGLGVMNGKIRWSWSGETKRDFLEKEWSGMEDGWQTKHIDEWMTGCEWEATGIKVDRQPCKMSSASQTAELADPAPPVALRPITHCHMVMFAALCVFSICWQLGKSTDGLCSPRKELLRPWCRRRRFIRQFGRSGIPFDDDALSLFRQPNQQREEGQKRRKKYRIGGWLIADWQLITHIHRLWTLVKVFIAAINGQEWQNREAPEWWIGDMYHYNNTYVSSIACCATNDWPDGWLDVVVDWKSTTTTIGGGGMPSSKNGNWWWQRRWW